MYRKTRRNIFINDINLDSLMDILTCLVGIMLLVVIVAVIEARGVNVRMHMPMVKDPPENSERIICICNKGRVRLFDTNSAIKKLSKSNLKLCFENIPKLVQNANNRNIGDKYFKYRLGYKEWTEGRWNHRSISITINERDSVKGDTVEELQEPSSKLVKLLKQFDERKYWIAFMVDKNSLEVFKKIREICIENGFTTGWDPGSITFPYTETILGGRDRVKSHLSPSSDLSKPQ